MTILRDLSVIWAMINIAIFFLVLMEFRVPMKRLIVYSVLYMIPLIAINLWFLLTFGPAKMAQSLFFIMLLPTVVFYFFLSKYRDGRFLYSFFLISDLNADLTMLTYLLDLAVPAPRYLVMFLSRLFLFPLLNIYAYRRLRRPYLLVQHSVDRGWGAFAVAAALFDILAVRLFSRPDMIENRPDDLVLLLIVIALTLLTNWYIFSALNAQRKLLEMHEREAVFLIQTSQLQLRIEESNRMKSLLAIERHDLRHRMHALYTMLLDGRVKDALAYLQKSDEQIADTQLSHWCKNTVLDAIFSYYFTQAKNRSIKIEADLNIPEQLETDATELSTVFANVLENAIHAVEALPEERRVIRCKCIRHPKLMFRVSNPYCGEIKWSADGLPLPADKPAGTGSRSIAAYCERHGAWCDYKVRDGWFTIQLTQP